MHARTQRRGHTLRITYAHSVGQRAHSLPTVDSWQVWAHCQEVRTIRKRESRMFDFPPTNQKLPYDHYEGAFMDPRTGAYLYVTADGATGNGTLWAREYVRTESGYWPATNESGEWRHVNEQFLGSILPMATYPTFSEVVALDYMREYVRISSAKPNSPKFLRTKTKTRVTGPRTRGSPRPRRAPLCRPPS